MARDPRVLLLVLLLFAALLRVYRLDELPPGLQRDEAYNGLDALRILRTANVPIFFTANEGREPAFLYLQTVAVALLGTHPFSLRIVSAMVGLLTLVLLYRLGRELYAGDERAPWVGLLAAGELAVSYWHLHSSRIGLRAIGLPAVSILAVWLFWRAWQTGRRREWLVAGLAVGVALYTYSAARALPLVFVTFVLLQAAIALAHRRTLTRSGLRLVLAAHRPTLIGLGLMTITVFVVVLPLGLYFAGDPNAFGLHANQLAVLDPQAPSRQGLYRLAENVWAVARMFVDQGDVWLKDNLPGRPALDVLAAAGFWIGLAAAVARVRRPVPRLLLLWLGVMLLPTVLSDGAPNFVRAIGALPPIFLLAADGLAHLRSRLAPRLAWAPFIMMLLLVSGLLSARDYFVVWAARADVYQEFDAGIVTLARSARVLARDNTVVLPLRLYGQPSPQFLLASEYAPTRSWRASHSDPRPALWLSMDDGSSDAAVVVLQQTTGRLGEALIPGLLDDTTLRRLSAHFARPDVVAIANRAGARVAAGARVDLADMNLTPLQSEHPLSVQFTDGIRLIGYDLRPTTVTRNQKVELVLYWESQQELARRYDTALALKDARDLSWSLNYREPWSGNFSTDLWRAGAVLPDVYTVRVPAQAHAGKYRFEIGLVQDRLPAATLAVVDATGRKTHDQVVAGAVTVRTGSLADPVVRHPVGAQFGDPALVTMVGHNLDRTIWQAGDVVPLELVWRADRRMGTDYTVFVHLLDDGGRMVAQRDQQPLGGDAPTSLWFQGESVADRLDLALPSDLAPGHYLLVAGLYDLKTGQRLTRRADGANPASDHARLGEITISGR